MDQLTRKLQPSQLRCRSTSAGRPYTVPNTESHLSPLYQVLTGLPPTGENGFEGFLRDAVATVIKRSLHLVKSGPQHGADAVVEDDNGPTVAVEAKKYQKTIPLDQLSAKLNDAIRNRPGLDLYIFGATTEIPANDQAELKAKAHREGIGIFFIDWPEYTSVLPYLAVLCKIAPEAIRLRVSNPAHLDDALTAVAEHPDFATKESSLQNALRQPDLGYEPLRATVSSWLRCAFTDKHASRAQLGHLFNINDPNLKRVERRKITDALDQWWRNGAQAPLVLTGDEGVGKSWAPMGWWEDGAGQNGENFPLFLYLPAKQINDIEISHIIAHRFVQTSGIRDESFWENRIKLWLRAPNEQFSLILMIDGLNEQPFFTAWNRLLAVLQYPPWYGRVSVIMTDRTQHWNQNADRFADLKHPPERINIEPFDDAELGDLLAGHGLRIQDFAPGLKDLLKIPRLSELAIRHRQRMSEAGDMTRERLIYEDWKDRFVRDESGKLISDIDFRMFISRIGRELWSNISAESGESIDLTERDLVNMLGADTGDGPEAFRDTLSDIINGHWMTPHPQNPHRFRLDPSRAIFALGMALVYDLADRDEATWNDRLAEFLEPLREQDKGVTILRNAVTIALLDPHIPAALRKRLLRTWLEQPNFRQTDFQSLRRLVIPGVETILDVAESYWLERSGEFQIDEILIKAIANEYEGEPEAAQKIRRWCSGWLGTYWADPLKGTVLGYDPSDPEIEEREEATRRRAAEWKAVPSSLAAPPPVQEREAEGVFWLACRVLGILSFKSPSTSTDALMAWAVSRAIMGHAPDFDQMAWILRLCPDLQTVETVRKAAENLAALDTDVGRRAAGNLLSALATPQAAHRGRNLGTAHDREHLPPPFAWVPEGQTRISWDYAHAKAKRPDPDSPLFFARDLGPLATDPGLTLPNESVARLRELATETHVSNLFQALGRTGADLDFENAEPALARWSPEELASLYHRLFFRAADRANEDFNQVAFKAPSRLFILNEAERSALVDAATSKNVQDKRAEHCVNNLLLADLPERESWQQIEKLKTWPKGPVFNEEVCALFAPPKGDDFESIAQELTNDKPKYWVCAWLWYLYQAPLDHLPRGYPALVPLFQHTESVVRTRAFEVVHASKDADLAFAVINSGWEVTEDTDRTEALAGSLAMLDCLEHGVLGAAIRKRISREVWGRLAIHPSAKAEDMDAFAKMLSQRLDEDLHPNPPTRKFGAYRICNEEPIERLAASRGDEMAQWIAPFLNDCARVSTSAFMDSYPYINVCSALLRHQPDHGVALWWALHGKAQETPFSSSDLQPLPFSAPPSEPVLKLRDEALDTTTTDQELETIAMALVRTSQEDWLRDRIERDLHGETAGRLARGLTLAGLLPPNGASDALWATALADSPATGWLADVHAWAKGRYQQACSAAHWLDAFFKETDRERAFSCHILFERCFARHHLPWVAKRRDAVWPNLSRPWRAHWDICEEELKQRRKKQEKESAKTLFGTKITNQIQWPWR